MQITEQTFPLRLLLSYGQQQQHDSSKFCGEIRAGVT